MMEQEVQKLKTQGIELTYTPKLLRELASLGYDQVYGARELRRVIQDRVQNYLAKMIVGGSLKSGSKIEIKNLSELN
jgi:ATP-dependent Clp protease ATP-binding subunit ClpA